MTENQPITTNNTTNKKLTNCKVCGTVMAKSAKKCQSCGAKNPRKAIKKLITFLIILAIIIGCPSFFAIKDKLNPAVKIIANNGETLSFAKFKDAYKEYVLNDDYDEFVDNYLPAQVSLSGKITEIDTSNVGVSNEGNSVHLDSNAANLIIFEIDNRHRYYISYELWTDKENYEFGKLKVGDKITATGTITKSITLRDGNYIADGISSSLEIIGTEDGITKK